MQRVGIFALHTIHLGRKPASQAFKNQLGGVLRGIPLTNNRTPRLSRVVEHRHAVNGLTFKKAIPRFGDFVFLLFTHFYIRGLGFVVSIA